MSNTNTAANLLQQLKDIKQPAPISWWPLTWGWYMVLGLCLIALSILAFYLVQHGLRRHRKRQILKEITLLRYSDYLSKQSIAAQLSILLKQILFMVYSRENIAGLQGEDWLLFLDKVSDTSSYTQGSGRLLMTAPYQHQVDDELDDLFELIEQTIERCL
ncbi:MAG: DUF4381 domain-containing protein [Gammaproteobacteria bacterium]|nr:DUF4381 domain-containing protein [Gammaproteobacteria bacterium]